MGVELIVLCVWLVPGILAYVLGSLYSKEWSFEEHDLILLFPLVNIVVLVLVLVILFDDLFINKIWE